MSNAYPIDIWHRAQPGLGNSRYAAILRRLADFAPWNPLKVGGPNWDGTATPTECKIPLLDAGEGAGIFAQIPTPGLYHARLSYPSPGLGSPHVVLVTIHDTAQNDRCVGAYVINCRQNQRVYGTVDFRAPLADGYSLEEHLILHGGALLGIMTRPDIPDVARSFHSLAGEPLATVTYSRGTSRQRTNVNVEYVLPW